MNDVKSPDFWSGGDPSRLLVTNPLARATPAVPGEVRNDSDYVYWRRDEAIMDNGRIGFRDGETADGAIWAFLDLLRADADRFGDFARKYGILGIRSDGLPGTAPISGNINGYPTQVLIDGETWFRESVEEWRAYVVGMRTVLALAMELRENAMPDPDKFLSDYGLNAFSWDALRLPMSKPSGSGVTGIYLRWIQFLSPTQVTAYIKENANSDLRSLVAGIASVHWLRYASLTPQLKWEQGQTMMTLALGDGYGLGVYPPGMAFSILAAQLAAVLSSEQLERIDQCSVCGRLFVPQIKPGRHNRSYCPEHKLEGDRERKRRWARKVAAERRAAGG